MNNTDIQVVVGPANYYSHPGALLRLDDFYHQEQLSRAVWIYGERAIAATHPFLPESFSLPGARHLPFGGHCTDPDLIALAQAAGEDRQVVIGVGGGALLDTAKALARRLDVPCVAIPTIAATCAAWTPLSVWYNSAGQASHYEVFNDANHLVLVEPEIVLRAPVEYLLAGIGDTLAKWYEAVVLAPEPDALPLTVRLGIDTAATLRDVLLNQSAAALEDQRNGVLSQNFRDVIDAIIAAYQQFNLPTTLAALDVDINNHTEIDQVIAHTLRPAASIHALPVQVTAESLRAAFITVEALGQ